ncbi:hypothetical protein AMTR_s00111p00070140 [Amborella trichopoda]|uniref:Uncharacterized protein n=1 Tax=Amborella trichopoda TaxID=13333 RepID=W1NXX2_AMBTC|nr:hypothetical protein AMTR_s00111p00070140 [Amborella trichopoda]
MLLPLGPQMAVFLAYRDFICNNQFGLKSGERIRIWKDLWIWESTLMSCFLRLISIAIRESTLMSCFLRLISIAIRESTLMSCFLRLISIASTKMLCFLSPQSLLQAA